MGEVFIKDKTGWVKVGEFKGLAGQPSTTRGRIVAAARSLKGKPFKHQSRSLDAMDCRGLLMNVADLIGMKTKRIYRDNYAVHPDGDEFRSALAAELIEIPMDDAGPGDCVMIKFPREKKATHVGILAQGPYEMMIVHAKGVDGSGSVCEEPLRRWTKYIVTAFRLPEVEPWPK